MVIDYRVGVDDRTRRECLKKQERKKEKKQRKTTSEITATKKCQTIVLVDNILLGRMSDRSANLVLAKEHRKEKKRKKISKFKIQFQFQLRKGFF